METDTKTFSEWLKDNPDTLTMEATVSIVSFDYSQGSAFDNPPTLPDVERLMDGAWDSTEEMSTGN